MKRKWWDNESRAKFRRVFGVAKPLTSPNSRRIHSPLLPPHIAPSKATLACKPIAFIENKNPQTHPEASLLVPTELGKGVESLLEQDSKPNHLVVPFTPICVNPSYWQQVGAKASGFKVSLTVSNSFLPPPCRPLLLHTWCCVATPLGAVPSSLLHQPHDHSLVSLPPPLSLNLFGGHW